MKRHYYYSPKRSIVYLNQQYLEKVFECTGADGIDYICAINTDGERVIEPREMWYRCTVGDKYLCNVDGVLTMFDSVTGAETALEGDLIVDGKHVYGDESVIVVETAEGYKLIDLNEPEKIYSPFES